jgi:hypothetical protein
MSAEVPEKREGLWRLAASPTLWAVHFVLCYAVAAVWCAKYAATPEAALTPVRIAIAVLTLLALFGVGLFGWDGYRRHRLPGGEGGAHHAADTPEDRHRFLGFATLLLSGLSAIAIVFEALAAVFIGSCR